MNEITIEQARVQATALLERVLGYEQLDVVVVGSLLVIVLIMSLATIWRNRRVRMATPPKTPSAASGFTRWLTPMGMASIPAAAQAAVSTRPARRTGSSKSLRVVTPVSKVPSRALRGAGADALEIARRSGLARDAVVMMMANASPRAAAKSQQSATKAAAKAEPTRAMSAPSAYATTSRAPQLAAPGRTLGTQFNARIS